MFWKSSSNGLVIFIFVFIFNLPLFTEASNHGRRYVYVATPMTGNSAQEYCRTHHTDLATIRNRNDLDALDENKTWEEALEHCRTLDTDSTSSNNYVNHSFDLPHMDFVRNSESEKVIQDSQTPEVWIGLRFLAGEWLWVNGMPLSEQLQACPPAGMHCGTMSKTGIVLPMRNCLERRNFLCFKKGLN
ncbi:hypothetical protein EYF80_060014 [Liparis tanakae]|uniref:C-type lectin domain-containing protein n=1 Tax=Liparis tanakae TaxID=230148 RepID=A0A4Z2ELR1_9TELE|nr:hypothetical protein EYF80_060014 [Liparis tanakae]